MAMLTNTCRLSDYHLDFFSDKRNMQEILKFTSFLQISINAMLYDLFIVKSILYPNDKSLEETLGKNRLSFAAREGFVLAVSGFTERATR